MPDLPTILNQEDLTVAGLFYQLLLGETQGMRSGISERRISNRRISNRFRDQRGES